MRETLSLLVFLRLTLVTFSPVDAPSISLRPLPGRCQRTSTVYVCLCVVFCQNNGSSKGQFIAMSVCVVSLCACVCFSISKVINRRRIRTVATCDLVMMITYVQPGLQACITLVAEHLKEQTLIWF